MWLLKTGDPFIEMTAGVGLIASLIYRIYPAIRHVFVPLE